MRRMVARAASGVGGSVPARAPRRGHMCLEVHVLRSTATSLVVLAKMATVTTGAVLATFSMKLHQHAASRAASIAFILVLNTQVRHGMHVLFMYGTGILVAYSTVGGII